MKGQWGLIFALIFALIIAIFSVINVNPVTVNYLFGHSEWPLILVILGSVLMGGLIVGSIGIVRVFRLQRSNKRLGRQLKDAEAHVETLQEKLQTLTDEKEAQETESDAITGIELDEKKELQEKEQQE